MIIINVRGFFFYNKSTFLAYKNTTNYYITYTQNICNIYYEYILHVLRKYYIHFKFILKWNPYEQDNSLLLTNAYLRKMC